MRWFDQIKGSRKAAAEAMEYAKRLAPIVASIFDSLKQHRYASSRPDFHFYVDPKLAEQFNINLHMIQEADSSDADGKIVGSELSLQRGLPEA